MSQLFNNDDNKHSVWGFSSHGSSKYAINTKIMIAAVVVLFIVVLFILVLHIYARWFWRTARLGSRGRSWSRRLRRRRMRFDFVTAESGAAAGTNNITNKGLDKAVMEALPVFFYTKKGKVEDSDEQPADEDDVLECAVCLSEFEENEAGRRLPKCNHVFHTECIDMWFSSHSTCPLCRTSVVMAPSEGDPLQQPMLENGDPVYDSRSQGERILHETVVSGLLGSSNHHANGNAMAIQILQDEGAVLLTRHQQDHYIVNIGSDPTSNGSSSSSSRQQQQQFPANVLFWGNQAYMSSHNLLSTTTHSDQQDKVTSSSSNRKLNSFKQQHLVIEVPRRSSGNFSSACSSQYPSPTTTEGGQKSPLGAHLRNIRRLLSRDSRRSSVDASPVGDCCEQQQLNSACNTPGSVSGCQTPTSQH